MRRKRQASLTEESNARGMKICPDGVKLLIYKDISLW